jgi:hypothetical protein
MPDHEPHPQAAPHGHPRPRQSLREMFGAVVSRDSLARPTPDEEGFRVVNRSEPAATSTRTRNKKAKDRLGKRKCFEVPAIGAPT